MFNRKGKKKLSKDIKQMLIVLVAAIVFAFVASIVAPLLDKKYKVYYPHDEEIIEKRELDEGK